MVEPFLVTRKDLFHLFGSKRLVQRLLFHGWIQPVRLGKPGREALYDFISAKEAFARYKSGEEPPLLPCELRHRGNGNSQANS